MQEIPPHRKLAHLSPGELGELIDQYYAQKPITELIKRFNIDCLPSQLYKLLPPEISPVSCPNCGGLMISERRARSTNNSLRKPTFYCQHCSHSEYGGCRCTYCRDRNRQKIDKSPRNPIKANNLTLEQTVALLSLVNCYPNRDIRSRFLLSPAKALKTPFAPSGDYGVDLIVRLVDADLLKQNALSFSSRNFSLRNGTLLTDHLSQVSLSNTVTPDLLENLESLISQRDWPMHWFEDVVDVAMNLAIAECKEFYELCTVERDFPPIEDRFIESMILNILEDFSPGQCMRIILSGAQYASDFLVKRSATPKMAANYMLEACQRFVDKARKENWELQSLRRNINCPRSMVSILLYDYILQLNDQELRIPIALLHLPQNS
ncbi:hypothetical protein [Methylomonas methanica]|uniref:Uncharacterized protein n=1 Tax=Methylomonas methanica (strain DSM 25384 / MC09) TaxID=857087 RepID=G0A4T9_METMM|nr:hypothetical protein [Methylomonas methanica]AEG02830.1 hypothetical protein Metme_4490 [Methylomonas methanica MC09]